MVGNCQPTPRLTKCKSYRNLCNSTNVQTSLSSIVSVYSRICGFDKFSDSLVVLNNKYGDYPLRRHKLVGV